MRPLLSRQQVPGCKCHKRRAKSCRKRDPNIRAGHDFSCRRGQDASLESPAAVPCHVSNKAAIDLTSTLWASASDPRQLAAIASPTLRQTSGACCNGVARRSDFFARVHAPSRKRRVLVGRHCPDQLWCASRSLQGPRPDGIKQSAGIRSVKSKKAHLRAVAMH